MSALLHRFLDDEERLRRIGEPDPAELTKLDPQAEIEQLMGGTPKAAAGLLKQGIGGGAAAMLQQGAGNAALAHMLGAKPSDQKLEQPNTNEKTDEPAPKNEKVDRKKGDDKKVEVKDELSAEEREADNEKTEQLTDSDKPAEPETAATEGAGAGFDPPSPGALSKKDKGDEAKTDGPPNAYEKVPDGPGAGFDPPSPGKQSDKENDKTAGGAGFDPPSPGKQSDKEQGENDKTDGGAGFDPPSPGKQSDKEKVDDDKTGGLPNSYEKVPDGDSGAGFDPPSPTRDGPQTEKEEETNPLHKHVGQPLRAFGDKVNAKIDGAKPKVEETLNKPVKAMAGFGASLRGWGDKQNAKIEAAKPKVEEKLNKPVKAMSGFGAKLRAWGDKQNAKIDLVKPKVEEKLNKPAGALAGLGAKLRGWGDKQNARIDSKKKDAERVLNKPVAPMAKAGNKLRAWGDKQNTTIDAGMKKAEVALQAPSAKVAGVGKALGDWGDKVNAKLDKALGKKSDEPATLDGHKAGQNDKAPAPGGANDKLTAPKSKLDGGKGSDKAPETKLPEPKAAPGGGDGIKADAKTPPRGTAEVAKGGAKVDQDGPKPIMAPSPAPNNTPPMKVGATQMTVAPSPKLPDPKNWEKKAKQGMAMSPKKVNLPETHGRAGEGPGGKKEAEGAKGPDGEPKKTQGQIQAEAEMVGKSAQGKVDVKEKGLQKEAQAEADVKKTAAESERGQKETQARAEGEAKVAAQETQAKAERKQADTEGEAKKTAAKTEGEAKKAAAKTEGEQKEQQAKTEEETKIKGEEQRQKTEVKAAEDEGKAEEQRLKDEEKTELKSMEKAGKDAEAELRKKGEDEKTAARDAGEQEKKAIRAEGKTKATAAKRKGDTDAAAAVRRGQQQAQSERNRGLSRKRNYERQARRKKDEMSWAEKAWNSVKGAFNSLMNKAKSAWNRAKQIASGFVNRARQLANSIKQKATQAVTAAWNWVDEKTGGVLTKVANKVKDIGGKVKGWVKDKWAQVKAKVNEYKNKVVGWVKKKWAAVKKTINDIKTRVTTAINDAKQWCVDRVNEAKKWVTDKVNAAKQWVADKITAAVSYVREKYNEIKARVQAAVALIVDTVKSAVKSAYDWCSKKLSEIGTWLAEAWDKFSKWAQEAFVKFWNGPWRDILIGIAVAVLIAAVTVATGGAGLVLIVAVSAAATGALRAGGEIAARRASVAIKNDPERAANFQKEMTAMGGDAAKWYDGVKKDEGWGTTLKHGAVEGARGAVEGAVSGLVGGAGGAIATKAAAGIAKAGAKEGAKFLAKRGVQKAAEFGARTAIDAGLGLAGDVATGTVNAELDIMMNVRTREEAYKHHVDRHLNPTAILTRTAGSGITGTLRMGSHKGPESSLQDKLVNKVAGGGADAASRTVRQQVTRQVVDATIGGVEGGTQAGMMSMANGGKFSEGFGQGFVGGTTSHFGRLAGEAYGRKRLASKQAAPAPGGTVHKPSAPETDVEPSLKKPAVAESAPDATADAGTKKLPTPDQVAAKQADALQKAMAGNVPGLDPSTKIVPDGTPGPLPPGTMTVTHAKRYAKTIRAMNETPTGRQAVDRIKKGEIKVTTETGVGSYSQGDKINIDPDIRGRDNRAGVLTHEAHHAATKQELPDLDTSNKKQYVEGMLRNEAEAQAKLLEFHREKGTDGGNSFGKKEYHAAFDEAASTFKKANPTATEAEVKAHAEAAGTKALEKVFGEATPSTSVAKDPATGQPVLKDGEPATYDDLYGRFHEENSANSPTKKPVTAGPEGQKKKTPRAAAPEAQRQKPDGDVDPKAKQSMDEHGHSGLELHNHMLGITKTQYFVDSVGGGDSVKTYKAVRALFEADPGLAVEAPHAARILKQVGDAPNPKAARKALEKLLTATDETAFDSAYTPRDELIKKHIDPASESNPDGHYKNFTEQTMKDLAGDGITYSEQSVSTKKLRTRVPLDLMNELHQKLKGTPAETDMRFLAMVNTSHLSDQFMTARSKSGRPAIFEQLGIPASKDAALIDAFRTKEHATDNGALKKMGGASQKRLIEAGLTPEQAKAIRGELPPALKKDLESLLTKRGDVMGIDIAAPETHRFTYRGKKNFEQMYRLVAQAAKSRKRPLVLRPHVGEGYVASPKGTHPDDWNRYKAKTDQDGTPAHYKRASKNIDDLLDVVQKLKDNGELDPDNVVVRFGHATHATPDQIRRMKELGIYAEANLVSNKETGASQPNTRGKFWEDHSLLTMLHQENKTILSTDAHGVMHTNLRNEYDAAGDIVRRFKNGEVKLEVDTPEGRKKVTFDQLSPADKAKFAVDENGHPLQLHDAALDYREKLKAGDQTDSQKLPRMAAPEGEGHKAPKDGDDPAVSTTPKVKKPAPRMAAPEPDDPLKKGPPVSEDPDATTMHDGKEHKPTYKDVGKEVFKGDPKLADVQQGYLADCYLVAGMASIAHARPDIIRQMVRDNGDGTATVTLHTLPSGYLVPSGTKGAKAHQIRVKKELPVASGSRPTYAKGKDGQLWPGLIEKAYAVHVKGNKYQGLNTGGNAAAAMEHMLGRRSKTKSTSSMKNDALLTEVESLASQKKPIAAGSLGKDALKNAEIKKLADEYQVFAWHAYTILGTKDGKILAHNPWGHKHPKPMPPEVFKKLYKNLYIGDPEAPKLKQPTPDTPDAGGKTGKQTPETDLEGVVTKEQEGIAPKPSKEDGTTLEPSVAKKRVGDRLQAGSGLDQGMMDAWIKEHGLSGASQRMGDHLLKASGLEPEQALALMKADPKKFYEEHGALVAGAVIRKGMTKHQSEAAAKKVATRPDANLIEFADELGFSLLTHFTPESRGGDILGTGSLLPGRDSGGLVWVNETTQTQKPTVGQRAAMADYMGHVDQALAMAVPKEMMIPPSKAYETHNLPEWLNKQAYAVKGKIQSAIGNAVGLPPMAVDGPISLLPKGMGLTGGEVDALRNQIAGSINTKSGQKAKIAFIVAAGTGTMARFFALYWPRSEEKEDEEEKQKTGK